MRITILTFVMKQSDFVSYWGSETIIDGTNDEGIIIYITSELGTGGPHGLLYFNLQLYYI